MLGSALSGNAWVIIPPGQPKEREGEILANSAASLLVSEKSLDSSVPLLAPGAFRPSAGNLSGKREAGEDDLAIWSIPQAVRESKGCGNRTEEPAELCHGHGAPFTGMGAFFPYAASGLTCFVLEAWCPC